MAAAYTESIKVLLPINEEDTGSESVWFLVTPEVKAAYDADEDGTIYEGILDNDSFDFVGLMHGTKLPFKMQGTLKPVVLFEALKDYKLSKDISF